MRVLAVAAEALELKPWLRRCSGVAALGWPVAFARRADWGGTELFAVAHGAGPRLAGAAVEAAVAAGGPFDAMLSVGLCGALDPSLALGAVCTASSVGDGESVWPAVAAGGAAARALLSIDRFLGQPEEKAAWAARGFGIVEMEAAAVAAYAAGRGVPFLAVKAVSDRAEERFSMDFNAYRDGDGRFARGRIARAAALHPFRYAPDLIRMAVRGAAGAETLGEYLGKFRI